MSSIITPVNTPEAFDFITLDGRRTPGLCRRNGGGDRGYKIDQPVAPAFGGAYTIFRNLELSTITYRFVVWLDPSKQTRTVSMVQAFDAEYAKLTAWLLSLNQGNLKRPVRKYRFLDLYLNHNAINNVVPGNVGAIEQTQGKQEWSAAVQFKEDKPLRIFGGVPKGAVDDRERTLEAERAAGEALRRQTSDSVASMERGGEGKGFLASLFGN